MRDLSATLLAAQKALSKNGIAKIVLELTDEDTQTYYAQSGSNRILDAVTVEEPNSITAQVLLDNADGGLTDLNLRGYTATISFGATTTEDEYSAKPGLKVLAQQRITSMSGKRGREDVMLTLFGLPNELAKDKANASYTPADDDTDTVKTLTRKIVNDTGVTGLDVYDHCDAHDLTFGTEDSLIDVFIPADAFSIHLNNNRWSKLQELLQYTKCVARAEASNVLRIFQPVVTTSTAWVADTEYIVGDTCIPITANDYEYKCTTAGTSDSTEPSWTTDIGDTISDNTVTWTVSYDYEYSLTSGEHCFLDKSHRTRLVIPNYVEVESLPSQETPYTGYAVDTVSQARMEKRDHHQVRATGDAQCVSIATAILSHHQMDAERGHARVPINFGAEVYDFVKVTDSTTYRAGNIGYLKTHYAPGIMEQEVRFGKITMAGLMGTAAPSSITGLQNNFDSLWDMIDRLMEAIEVLQNNQLAVVEYLNLFGRYIYLDDDGDIILNPKFGRHTYGERIFVPTRLKIPVGTDMYD